jgi:hypothetical protein
VKTHVGHVLEKLNLRDRVHAARPPAAADRQRPDSGGRRDLGFEHSEALAEFLLAIGQILSGRRLRRFCFSRAS